MGWAFGGLGSEKQVSGLGLVCLWEARVQPCLLGRGLTIQLGFPCGAVLVRVSWERTKDTMLEGTWRSSGVQG